MFKRTDEKLVELFDKAKTRNDIANLLEIEEKSLRYFLFVKRPENLYTYFEIPKKHGGIRQIYAPMNEWRNIQRKLSYVLSLKYHPRECVYGFVNQKNIVGNASCHTKKAEILNIDLKDFFTQFHFGRVVGMLKSKPYLLGDEAAITIAQIACLNGVLPQGSPTSPVLTNMICASLDTKLLRYAKKHKLVYTRYADDITLSSYTHNISEIIVFRNGNAFALDESLGKIFSENSFIVNEDKITLRTRDGRQEVTGVIVNKFPNVKREYVQKLRALLHNCMRNGVYNEARKYIDKGLCKNRFILEQIDNPEKQKLIEEWYKSVLVGKINYIRQIKGKQSFTFYALALLTNKIFSEKLFDLSYFDRINAVIDNNVFVLCNNDETVQGSGFFVDGYGLFTSYHVTEEGDIFYVWKNDKKIIPTSVCATINQKFADKTIDYALYEVSIPDTISVSIGNSSEIKVGDTVFIAGFPDYLKGDSITKEQCQITGKTTLFGAPFFKVSGRVVHGASGGIVLNEKCQIVGIIKGGCASNDENNITIKQGFVPIDVVMEDIGNKSIF